MDKQAEIVQAATPLFLKNGFRGLTVDDLSKELGVSKKTIYKYFSAKEDLIESVKNYLVNFSTLVNAEVEPITKNCVDQTFAMVNFVESEFGFHQLRVSLKEAKNYYSHLSDDLTQVYMDVAANICRLVIARGLKDGHIDENINIDYTSLVFGQVYIFLSTSKYFQSKQAFDKIFNQWIYMICKIFLNEDGLKILDQKMVELSPK